MDLNISNKIKNPQIYQFLVSINNKVKLTASQMREIVEMLLDLEERFDDVLQDKEINRIISDSNLTKKGRGTQFYERIKVIRYPELTRYQLEFKKQIKKIIQNRNNLRLETSPFFEDNSIKLSITATSNAELEETFKYLLKITQDGRFSRIFDLYSTGA